MKSHHLAFLFGLLAVLTLHNEASADLVVDFEELTVFTGASPQGGGSFYNGNDGSNTTNSDGWTSQGVLFNNNYNGDFLPSFDFWSGWSYSNVVNITGAGFTNQYAAFAGGGSDGVGGVDAGGNYAVAFGGGAYFNLPNGSILSSVDLSNTTYAGLSMQTGDSFAKQFGGVSGNDPDFFRVTLTGFDSLDATGNTIGSVTADLADFTFADNSQDYILDDWSTFDLSGISTARSVGLTFESSDTGPFGINTPTYVALDNLTFTAVPEPSSLALLVVSGTAYTFRRVRKRCKPGSSSNETV